MRLSFPCEQPDVLILLLQDCDGTCNQLLHLIPASSDLANGSLFPHLPVLKAGRELGAKPFRKRQGKCLRG
jgi:hypothetical protein